MAHDTDGALKNFHIAFFSVNKAVSWTHPKNARAEWHPLHDSFVVLVRRLDEICGRLQCGIWPAVGALVGVRPACTCKLSLAGSAQGAKALSAKGAKGAKAPLRWGGGGGVS